MLIGVSEGQGLRYEIVERLGDFLVQMHDLDTGALEENEGQVFRTAAVAFTYAELSAAFDRFAAARVASEDVSELEGALAGQQALYQNISAQLSDEGVSAQRLVAWEHAAAMASRRRFHWLRPAGQRH